MVMKNLQKQDILIKQLGNPRSGESRTMGSGSVTSRPAAKICPEDSAAARAFSSHNPPLAVLMKTAVDFMRANASAPKTLYVSGVSGACREM